MIWLFCVVTNRFGSALRLQVIATVFVQQPTSPKIRRKKTIFRECQTILKSTLQNIGIICTSILPRSKKKLCWKSSQVADFCCSSKVWQETQGVLSADVDVKCNKMPLCLSSPPLKKWAASQLHLFVWKPETEKSQKGFFSTNRCAWD